MSKSILAFALFGSVSTSALAAPATPEEAARLKVVVESYVGAEAGIVAVMPVGETYELKLDFQPYLNKAASIGGSVTITPYTLFLKPEGGGIWTVTQDSPFSLTGSIESVANFSFKIDQMKGVSTFDEAIGAFTTSRTELINLNVEQTITVPGAPPSQTKYSVANTVYDSKVSSAPGGAVDGTMIMTSTGYTQSMQVPGEGENPVPVTIDVKADTLIQTSAYKGLKARAITDIVRWFIAHPSEAQIDAGRADMVKVIEAALPLFGTITSDAQMSNLTVTTPFGPVGIAKAGIDVDMNGAVADGMLREAFSAEGITLPPGLVPPFAADLVPEKFSLDFTVSNFDAAAPAKLLLAHIAKTKDAPTPELEAELLKALMPSGAVKITLAPGEVTSKIASIGYQGDMTAGTAAMPQGSALITAKGFDAAIEALKAAPPELGLGEGLVGALAIKGFGKTETDGSISWKIESTPEGGVLVNGLDMSKLGK